MDEHNNDPYEQQLYAVFQSCLTKGEAELQEENWLTLCHKLHLTEQSEELKSCIRHHTQEKRSISFQEFRAALLALLDQTQELVTHAEKDSVAESQSNLNSPIVDSKVCSLLSPTNSRSTIDIVNVKPDATLDESRLKCLWEKIDSCLKENVDCATMYFISNCLGIPALPKQIIQCIFERLDQNCDGLISLDEFFIIFQNRTTMEEQLILDKNNESIRESIKSDFRKQIIQCIFERLDQNCDGLISLDEFFIIFQNRTTMEEQLILDKNNESIRESIKSDFRKRTFDLHTPRKASFTRNNTYLDTWKLSGHANASLLTDRSIKTSEACLSDLTTTLCEELKNFNDSLDHSTIRSHITLLRDVLILYQEELHSLNLMIESKNSEKDKLRADVIEANERANTLAQEIDEQHTQQEVVLQNLRKQLEQRHTEVVQDYSSQLSSERETNSRALKAKNDQLQILQKENHEIRNKFVNTLQENQVLEAENENLRSKIEKLKQSNNELQSLTKELSLEYDETQDIEVKHQQEVIFLVDRIKHLQSETVSLRDQNDELTIELETLKVQQNNIKDSRQNNLEVDYTTTNIQIDETEGKAAFTADVEDDLDVLFKHSTPNTRNRKKTDLKSFKDLVVKQLKSLLANSNACTLEDCMFRSEISGMVAKLQSNSNIQTLNETDTAKSIASEMKTEFEERTSESLRDFVVPKHKNSLSVKRITVTNNNDNNFNIDDNFNNPDIKNVSQNKVPSLRDYPPRKEEHTAVDHSKANKEKDFTLHHLKITNDVNVKSSSGLVNHESVEDVHFLKVRIQELETIHVTEKKQLTEQCAELERSLELLKIAYEECEDYWTAKLEEERQLFEQEQKISDEKFSELITKMEEYEELISPTDKIKNSGRLSPIEERFNLEQQYLDLVEEFEKWKAEMEEEKSQKDNEIDKLREMKSVERPAMTDISVQVTDDLIPLPPLMQSNYVPNNLFNIQPSTEFTSKFTQCSDNINKLPEEFRFNRILESSALTSDFIPRVKNEHIGLSDCTPRQMHTEYSVTGLSSTCKIEKPGPQWKVADVGGRFSKEEYVHNLEYDFVSDPFKSQNCKAASSQCMRTDAQPQVCSVSLNVLQSLSMKLQTQEHKKLQLQERFKQQKYQIERVLQHIISQHQLEVTQLQYLLRSTQEQLHLESQTNAEQAERLIRTDILVKDLYVENAYLSSNLKRLQQHYNMLKELNAESTSI